MSSINRFPIWRYAGDLPLFRTVGAALVPFVTQYRPWSGVDHFDIPFTLDSFAASDEIDSSVLRVACPCGERVIGYDAAELLRDIYEHCAKAGHPRPGFEQ